MHYTWVKSLRDVILYGNMKKGCKNNYEVGTKSILYSVMENISCLYMKG